MNNNSFTLSTRAILLGSTSAFAIMAGCAQFDPISHFDLSLVLEEEKATVSVGITVQEVAAADDAGQVKKAPPADVVSSDQVHGVAKADVKMVNQHAVRNLPITESLSENISLAVGAVYGPGFTVQVYSGGQHDHKTATKLGVGRVGTTAHDHGHAADAYIIDPNGRRIKGDALAPLAQYWLAAGLGGVGLEMRGGGIHLDERRVRFWDYAKDGGSITKTQLAAFVDGKRGTMPKLYSDTTN